MSDTATPAGLVQRLSVNINPDTQQALKRLKDEKGISLTEAVRRAVSLLDLVDRESARGSKLQLVEKDGSVRELMFLA